MLKKAIITTTLFTTALVPSFSNQVSAEENAQPKFTDQEIDYLMNTEYKPEYKEIEFDLTNPNEQSYQVVGKDGIKHRISLSAATNPLVPSKDPLQNKSDTIMRASTGSTFYLPYGSYTRKVTGTSIIVSMGFTANTYVPKSNTSASKITSATNPWGESWLGTLSPPKLTRPSTKSARVTAQYGNNVGSTTVWVQGTIVENTKLKTTYQL